MSEAASENTQKPELKMAKRQDSPTLYGLQKRGCSALRNETVSQIEAALAVRPLDELPHNSMPGSMYSWLIQPHKKNI